MIAGLVLAGGRSRRMGEADKARAMLGGMPLVGRAIARLRPQVSAIAVSTNDPGSHAGLGVPLLADTVPGFAGPLAGMLAGLLWARRELPGARHLATVAVDTPFFPADLVARLAAVAGGGAAIARSAGREHPTCALLPVILADDLAAFLAAGTSRRASDWLGRHAPAIADFTAPEDADPFFNVNTPEDLHRAEARLGCASRRLGEL